MCPLIGRGGEHGRRASRALRTVECRADLARALASVGARAAEPSRPFAGADGRAPEPHPRRPGRPPRRRPASRVRVRGERAQASRSACQSASIALQRSNAACASPRRSSSSASNAATSRRAAYEESRASSVRRSRARAFAVPGLPRQPRSEVARRGSMRTVSRARGPARPARPFPRRCGLLPCGSARRPRRPPSTAARRRLAAHLGRRWPDRTAARSFTSARVKSVWRGHDATMARADSKRTRSPSWSQA
jgi:hypothetical protein